MRLKTAYELTIICGGLAVLSAGAFTNGVRKEILRRDNHTCACGRCSKSGWLLHASHLDHTRDEKYNLPENGVTECIPCHIQRHIGMFRDDPNQTNHRAIELLAWRAMVEGFHKRSEYENNPELLPNDRQELTRIFEDNALNIRYFVKTLDI